jgi:lysophospholipase L1-like esterase
MCERYSNMVDDADIITIFGGTNDFGNTVPLGVWGDTVNTTLYGAMKILVEGLLTKYPGKRIGFILPIPRASQTSPTSGLKNYINVIKDVCDRYSVPTLDLYTQSGLAPDFAANKSVTIPDGLHPSDAGHLLISYKIEAFIRRL